LVVEPYNVYTNPPLCTSSAANKLARDNLTGERELKYFFQRTCKLRDTIRTLVNLVPTSTILLLCALPASKLITKF
jgi:hypothetical protein